MLPPRRLEYFPPHNRKPGHLIHEAAAGTVVARNGGRVGWATRGVPLSTLRPGEHPLSRGRSPDRTGALFQPGLRADGVPPRCSGDHTPTTDLQRNASAAAAVTCPHTNTPTTRGASGRGACVNV